MMGPTVAKSDRLFYSFSLSPPLLYTDSPLVFFSFALPLSCPFFISLSCTYARQNKAGDEVLVVPGGGLTVSNVAELVAVTAVRLGLGWFSKISLFHSIYDCPPSPIFSFFLFLFYFRQLRCMAPAGLEPPQKWCALFLGSAKFDKAIYLSIEIYVCLNIYLSISARSICMRVSFVQSFIH